MQVHEDNQSGIVLRLTTWFTSLTHDAITSVDEQNKRIQRIEPILLLFLLVQAALVLVSYNNPPELFAVVGITALNILLIFVPNGRHPLMGLLRALLMTASAGYLVASANDPSNALYIWFYLIVVYYSMLLVTPYQIVVIIAVPATFVLTYFLNPRGSGISELVTRVILLLALGVVMTLARMAIQRSLMQRAHLMDALRLARDDYAKQLDERTAQLQTQIQERMQIEAKLAEERQVLRTVIDTFPSRLYVKDRDSRFTLVNRWSSEGLGLEQPDDVIGKSDFDFYPHFAERTHTSEQHLMATGEPLIDFEETTLDSEGIERHYLISKVPMYHQDSDEIVGLVGVTTEITTLKETQIALRKSQESLKQFQARLTALNQITIELTRINTFEALAFQSIQQAKEKLGFDRISCWFIDPANRNQLIGAYRVSEQGEIESARDLTMQVTPDHPAYDIVNEIKRDFVWFDSPIYGLDFETIGTGDKAVTALLDGEKVIGCLFIDNLLDKKPFDESHIELLKLYGATLGVLFNRQRAEEALRSSEEQALRFQQQLKRLNQVTMKLEVTDSLEELCRQAILLGRQQLGFERLGIWLTVEGQPNMRRGMWGTDKDGNLRDEHDLLLSIPDNEANMVSEGEISVRYDFAFIDVDGSFLGRGWKLTGLLWDGYRRVGWLYADNAISGQPLTQKQYDLFQLYVATIGLLSAQRIAEGNLRESEIRYRAITEASSDIVVIFDREMSVTYISPSLKNVLGIEPQDILGKPVNLIVHRDDVAEAERKMQLCLQSSGLITRVDDFRVRHANGNWLHMEAILTSLIDDPVVNGIVVSCRDLTHRIVADERKRIMERERERASVLRQLISDVSHDFRTPLSTISTAAYLLQRGKSEDIERRVAMINQQIQRIESLVNSLNTITKLDETNQISMQEIDFNQILQSIPHERTRMLAEKQLTLTLDLQDNLPSVIGNTQLLYDAVQHLVDNAIQFSHADDTITIQSYQEQDDVVIQVVDTGMGIGAEDLPYIFDRLYRADKARNTHTGGSGLGLTITRRIMDLHNGKVDITSEVNQGTVVYLRLPCKISAYTKSDRN